MIDTIKQSIGAGGFIRSQLMGRSFYLKKAAFPVTIRFHGHNGKFLGIAEDIESGFYWYGGETSEMISFTIESANAQDIVALVSSGAMGFDKIDIANVSATYERSATVVTLADVTIAGGAGGLTAVVYAGNVDCHHLLISNMSDFSARIGDVNTGAARGGRLFGQMDIIVDSGGALYAYVAAGESVTFALTVFEK